LYVIYGAHTFPDAAHFKKTTLDYACDWGKDENQIDPILSALLTNFAASYSYTAGGNCYYLSKDFDHLSKALGISSKLHKWASPSVKPGFSHPGDWAIDDMATMFPNEFEPIGSLSWAALTLPSPDGIGNGSSAADGWGYHEWIEANGTKHRALRITA